MNNYISPKITFFPGFFLKEINKLGSFSLAHLKKFPDFPEFVITFEAAIFSILLSFFRILLLHYGSLNVSRRL